MFPKSFGLILPGWVTTSRAMFKKTDTNKPADPLAHRMRKIAAVPAEEVTYSSVTTRRKTLRTQADLQIRNLDYLSGERMEVVVKNVSDRARASSSCATCN